MGAAEGDLKKVDGDIWYAADVTAVLNAINSTTADSMQSLFNAEYLGLSQKYNANQGLSLTNSKITTGIQAIGSYSVLDDFQGTTISDTWNVDLGDSYRTVRSVSQNDKLTLSAGGNNNYSTLTVATVNVSSDGTTPFEIINGSYFFNLDYILTSGSLNGYSNFSVQITDGTTTVTIQTFNSTNSVTKSGELLKRLNIDKTAKTYGYFDDFSNLTTTSSLSSLDNGVDWYLNFFINGRCNEDAKDRGLAIVNIYDIEYLKQPNVENIYYIDFGSVGEVVTNIMIVSNNAPDNELTTYEISVDNGETYESLENKKIHIPTVTGQEVIVKCIYNCGSETSLAKLNEIGIKYNLY